MLYYGQGATAKAKLTSFAFFCAFLGMEEKKMKNIPEKYFTYLGEETKAEDFDYFWKQTLQKVLDFNLTYSLTKNEDYFYPTKEIFKLVFTALDGTKIYGWYLRETNRETNKCLLTTHGYRSSKKEPHLYLHWLDAGYDVLAFDMRLQAGETGCNTPLSGPMSEVITINAFDLENCYLKMIYTDMMLASLLPEKLGYQEYVLEGTSQAGGLAVAIGCLMQNTTAVLANVPSNSDLDQRVLKATGSFKAFQSLCKHDPEKLEMILHHLSYFDTKNLANRLTAPIFASVGGVDNVCPAKAFFATYNRIQSPKEIYYYPFNGHEGGGSAHTEREIAFLHTLSRKV